MQDAMHDALVRAVTLAGGQTALARRLTEITGKTVSQPRVWWWIEKSRRVPPDLCVSVERAVDGQVTRYELRPDVFQADTAA